MAINGDVSTKILRARRPPHAPVRPSATDSDSVKLFEMKTAGVAWQELLQVKALLTSAAAHTYTCPDER